jgi:O-antigen ligase
MIPVVIGATLVLATLAFGAVHYWALGFLAIGAALVIALWCADAWTTREFRFSASWLQLPLAATAMLGLLQLLPLRRIVFPGETSTSAATLSLDPFATRMAVVLIVVLLIYFAAALAFVDSRHRLNRLAAMIFVFGVIIAGIGLIQYFVSPLKIYGIREPNQALPFGPFINRNHFAAFLVMIIPLPLALIMERAVGRDRIPLYGSGVLLMVIAVFTTGARAGLLTLTSVVGFLVLLRVVRYRGTSHRGRPLVFAAAAAGALIGALVLVLLLGGAAPLSRILGQSPAGDATAGDRLQYWRASTKLIAQHPLVGVGLDAFGIAYPRYDSLNGAYRVERAHNDYLQVLAETGLLGALLALSFVFILFRQGWAAAGQTHNPLRRALIMGALAGCFGALVHSFFEFPLRTPSNALLFLLLAAIATVDVGSARERAGESAAALERKDDDAGIYRPEPSDRIGDDHL